MAPNRHLLRFQVVIFAAVTTVFCCGRAAAQPINFEGNLPVVADLEPRPSEGSARQQQWRTQRTDLERAPVAEFLDSLKGNDAAIEVIVSRSKLLTTKEPIASQEGVAVIAVSDPTVVDFDVLPDSRMIRLIGRTVGVTDLMFVAVDGQTYSFAVHVVYDLDLLRAHLKQLFPDALLNLGQIREHLVVEGQARSDAQVEQILNTINVFLMSSQRPGQTASQSTGSQIGAGRGSPRGSADRPQDDSAPSEDPEGEQSPEGEEETADPGVAVEEGGRPTTSTTIYQPQIINLLTVPGVHQVMLKVQIAEINRVALRQIGSDLFAGIGNNNVASFGGSFAEPSFSTDGSLQELLFSTAAGTLVGVFDNGSFSMVMQSLRRNNVATILAEPNLVTLSGHEARFQSGGQFPVPVAQAGGGGGFGVNTVEFKDFGIQLAFIPFILDDGVIRLHVEPEVSSIAEDLSVSLIVGGSPIPGLRTRNAATTVELRPGQTLAIAGLMSRDTDGNSSRIPFLGDLPYIGWMFGSRQSSAMENELLVAVTPYLVSPMNADQRPPLPGHEVMEPNDLEFFLLNRLEGRTGRPHRSTGHWDNPFRHQTQMEFEQQYFFGPVGLTE